jgi:hypothetical protein
MPKTFDYVIARHWDNGSKCIYTYHTQVHHGSIESARNLLDYVKRRSPEHDDYKIYKINYEEVE